MPLKVYLLTGAGVAAGLCLYAGVFVRLFRAFRNGGAAAKIRTAIFILLLAGASLTTAFVLLPCFDWPGHTVCRGPTDAKILALTFDDGPSSPYTGQVLDILKSRGIPATFFVLGKNVQKYPELVDRMIREGYVIGNHTFDHEPLIFMNEAKIESELDRWETAMAPHAPFSKSPLRLFRAPHGWKNPLYDGILRKRNYQRIGWTMGVWDTDRPGKDVILQRLLGRVRNGSIILLHDGSADEGADRSQTVEALPGFIDDCLRDGYRFVDIPALLESTRHP